MLYSTGRLAGAFTQEETSWVGEIRGQDSLRAIGRERALPNCGHSQTSPSGLPDGLKPLGDELAHPPKEARAKERMTPENYT